MYHGLDSSFRPLGRPEDDPSPPAYPERVKAFVYGCALFADEMDTKRASLGAGGGMARRVAG
jgi:hypothetical protein